VVSLGIFFLKLPTEPCALGSTRALQMSTRNTPGGKDDRCLRVTTLPPSQCRVSRKFGVLSFRISKGLLKRVAGKLYLYLLPLFIPFSVLHILLGQLIRDFAVTAVKNSVSYDRYIFSDVGFAFVYLCRCS
jgi:hypothetical protein